jgi:hypothetical protein
MAKKILYSSVLLLLGTIFLIPATSPVHGQFTGTVCIIATSSASCPSSPATIGGTVGTQLRVTVFIQGSDALNGAQVILLADHTIIKPAGADITGTVVPGGSILQECIGGVLVRGNVCGSRDTADTIDVAVIAGPGQITNAPTTGLLFTAIYNVTAATSGTPIGYQTGCAPPTSVSNTCITITNGTLTPDPENAQTAVFTTGDFTISANPASLSLQRSSQTTSTITLNSIGSFAGTVSLTTTISPTNKAPSESLSMSAVTLTSGGTASVTLTVTTEKNTGFGTYTVTVTGTSGNIAHPVTVTVTVTH